MSSKRCYVYAIHVNGVVRYIGKCGNGRLHFHLIEAGRINGRRARGARTDRTSTQFYRKLAEAVRHGATITEEIIIEGLTDQEAYRVEKHKIEQGDATIAKQARIHPSRVVKFLGAPSAANPARVGQEAVWGDSVLQAVDDAVKNAGTIADGVAAVVQELKIDIVHIQNLSDVLSTQEGTNKLANRFSNANVLKSIINTLLLDEKEEWERVEANLAGVADLMREYLIIASGAADIPATRFLSISRWPQCDRRRRHPQLLRVRSIPDPFQAIDIL